MSSNPWSLDKLLKIAKDKEAAAEEVKPPVPILQIAPVPQPALVPERALIQERATGKDGTTSPSFSEPNSEPKHAASVITETVLETKVDSTTDSVRLTESTSLAESVSQTPEPPLAQRGVSLTESVSPMDSVSLTDSVLHFWEALGDWKRGHLSLPNQIVLVLYRHLDPAEQAVYTQLYAMSWGYGKPDCFCNLATLAARAGMGTTAVGQAVKRLVSKGLIEKSAVQLGKGNDQGITYRLPLPDRLTESVRLTRSGRPTDSVDKKDMDQKQIKKGVAAGDCPDCNGTFWVYPDGPEGGVKKCSHPKLKRIGK
jgi:hypothetical protein